MYRWIRGVSRLIPNSSESNSPIILFSSLHSKTSFSPTLLTYGAYDDLVHVVGTAKDAGGGGIGASFYKRKTLPEGLAEHVVKLTCESTAEGGVCDVYLLGTNHLSPKSCQEVQAMISFLKPQVVFMELCSSRISVLTENFKVGMYGGEFRIGFDEAVKYGGKVILGDRPYEITERRKWARLSLWDMTKLITFRAFPGFFLPEFIKEIQRKEKDALVMERLLNQETSKRFPTYIETILHERDKYMSSTLHRVAREHNSVVAVVGKGHLDGISWKEPIEIMDLLEMPVSKPGVPVKKILKFLGVAVAGVAITAGIYNSSKK